MMDLAPQWKLISFWRLSRRQMSDFEHQHYQELFAKRKRELMISWM